MYFSYQQIQVITIELICIYNLLFNATSNYICNLYLFFV